MNLKVNAPPGRLNNAKAVPPWPACVKSCPQSAHRSARDDMLHGMMKDRLIELETRMAYQDATLQQLNDIVTAQQQRIDQLERALRELAGRVARSAESVFKGTAADEVPPHY